MPIMAAVQERVSILETKVDGINEKIDDVKSDVRENHNELKTQLKTMYDASCTQHAELAKKINDIEGFKNKWTYIIFGGLAVAGWVTGHFDAISKVLN